MTTTEIILTVIGSILALITVICVTITLITSSGDVKVIASINKVAPTILMDEAEENAVVNIEITKKTIAEYLKNTYKEKVICKERAFKNSKGLVIPDTHYKVLDNKKTCNIFVYQLLSDKVFMLLKTTPEIYKTIKKKHKLIRPSSFPKTKYGQWYNLIIDDTFTSFEDVSFILNLIEK